MCGKAPCTPLAAESAGHRNRQEHARRNAEADGSPSLDVLTMGSATACHSGCGKARCSIGSLLSPSDRRAFCPGGILYGSYGVSEQVITPLAPDLSCSFISCSSLCSCSGSCHCTLLFPSRSHSGAFGGVSL